MLGGTNCHHLPHQLNKPSHILQLSIKSFNCCYIIVCAFGNLLFRLQACSVPISQRIIPLVNQSAIPVEDFALHGTILFSSAIEMIIDSVTIRRENILSLWSATNHPMCGVITATTETVGNHYPVQSCSSCNMLLSERTSHPCVQRIVTTCSNKIQRTVYANSYYLDQ